MFFDGIVMVLYVVMAVWKATLEDITLAKGVLHSHEDIVLFGTDLEPNPTAFLTYSWQPMPDNVCSFDTTYSDVSQSQNVQMVI